VAQVFIHKKESEMEKLPLILAAIVAVAKVAKAFLDDKKNKED